MFTTRPELRGTLGMVASTHWLASAAGMGVLERGGNAFDAAVTAGLVLQVVEPHLNGPGGDMPALICPASSGEVTVICGQGPAPAAATIERFGDLGLDVVPGTGLLAACVPGAMDAWLLMLRDHGTWEVADVMAPAIHYAEEGYPLVPRIADTIRSVEALFRVEWPSSANVYLPGGNIPSPHRLFRNPALARTFRRLSEAAGGASREARIDAVRRQWSSGFVAEAIDTFFRETRAMDVSGRHHNGLLTGNDMAGWEATHEAPVSLDYHGHRVFKCGPWSQGPALLQQLAMLSAIDIADLDPSGSDFVHLVTEAAKLAMADRDAWYGDPDFVDVPLETLLSPDYAATRRELIGSTASRDLRPGAPDGRDPQLADRVGGDTPNTAPGMGFGAGEPTVARHAAGAAPRGDTCHLDVVDRHGNLVSATPSGGWLQSSPVIPELGFCLGTRMQMFWLDPKAPASLVPGKRPRTTLTPSLAFRDGQPYMAFGTPGGDSQDQWQLAFFLRHVTFGMGLQAAIDAPAFHTTDAISSFWPRQRIPGGLTVEANFDPDVIEDLTDRGHHIEVGPPWSEGRLSAVAVEATPEGRMLKAAANPRGMQGYAVGR